MTSIAIMGGGPAGLTLARLLEKANLSSLKITVFEMDESPLSRTYQGGTLDLHPETGLAAIRGADLWDKFSKHARYDGEELYIRDKNATVYLHMKDAPQIPGFDARPEIDREKLKEILLHSVKPETIQWGKKLRSIDEQSGNLTFADGSQAGPFDLVVGGEGAWSKVRRMVSDAMPSYSGICGMEANITATSAGAHWETLSQRAGRGSTFAFQDGKSIMAQRMGDGSLKLSIWVRKSMDWPAQIIADTDGDEEKIKRILTAEFEGWDESMLAFIASACYFRPRPLYELPVGHQWEHKKGWTLIGDAAHLMTPFAGEGVNAAMRDSLDLAKSIIKALTTSEITLDQAVAAYEESLFPRSTKVQEDTASNKEAMFNGNGPPSFMVSVLAFAARDSGYDLNKGLLAWVPISRAVYGIFWTIGAVGSLRRTLWSAFSR